MDDAEVVRIARKIDARNRQIHDLINEIARSDHPHAARIVDNLWANNFDTPAWARHVVSSHLAHPERWETGYFGIRRKRARKT